MTEVKVADMPSSTSAIYESIRDEIPDILARLHTAPSMKEFVISMPEPVEVKVPDSNTAAIAPGCYPTSNNLGEYSQKLCQVQKNASPEIEYVFNEKQVLADALAYINTTYSGHYSSKKAKKGRKKKIQVTEFACSHCEAPHDALRFNVLKYAARYGQKNGFNKLDLLKSLHYIVMMIDNHDQNNLGAIEG